MIFSHHFRFVTRRLCYHTAALLLVSLFCIISTYYVTEELLTTPKAFSNSRLNFKRYEERGTDTHHQLDESITGNGTVVKNNDSERTSLNREYSSKELKRTVNVDNTQYQSLLNDTELNEIGSKKIPTTKGEETTIIDIDKVQLPINILYEKLTLVTCFSQNHFQEGLGFIGSAQHQMPNKTIIVYDLGLNEDARKMIRSLCNVRLRQFPFENYPVHLKRLHTFGFKATIINLALNEFGVIYYGDASIRFKKSLLELLPACVGHHGFLGQIRCFDPKVPHDSKNGCYHDYHLTRNEMYAKIGVNKTDYYNANYSSPALSGGLMLVVNSTTVQSKIMKPWLRCSMDVTCIAPNGANLGNHRFDQSALSLTVFKNLRGEWTFDNDPTPIHNAVVSVQRGTNGYNWHPKSCS
ncbi:hypothetical protein HOLleu_43377 [Holothuria leucospilota]|uniref:Uncharacterized protein n=1 Tax=Holothuria leucospilota TaxID=206669 RepID=A0A9Q0YEH1_HOLLE|nr:hypothetical protein HOLleu_43377 [Holothuria leucospilota]